MVLRAMIDFDQNNAGLGVGGGVSLMNPAVDQFSSRFRSRLHHKGGMMMQPPSPNPSEYISSSSPRSTYGIGELNRRITDLKVDHPALSPPHTNNNSNFIARDSSPKLLELGTNYGGNATHYQQTTLQQQYNQQLNQQIRRDSNNSTTSSSYYSMKSCDISRRSSNQSHTSSISTLRPGSNVSAASAANYNNNYDPNLFYDPISAGSSRRSSQLSTNDCANYGPPSSQLLSSHLARLQRHHSSAPNNHPYNSAASFYQHNNNNINNQPYNYQASPQGASAINNQMFYNYPHANIGQNFPTSASHMMYNFGPHINNVNNNSSNNRHQLPSSSTDRRMSEPISNSSRNVPNDFTSLPIVQRPRSTTPTKSLEMLLDNNGNNNDTSKDAKQVKSAAKAKAKASEKEKADKDANSPSKPHPNETVVLDVLKTNEKIENCDELVIPDDMMLYLNRVGDEIVVMPAAAKTTPRKEAPKIKLDLDEIEPMSSSSIAIEKIKEEDLYTLLADVDVKTNDDNDVSNNDVEQQEQFANNENNMRNDYEINNNGQDDCKIESDTKTHQIPCKS